MNQDKKKLIVIGSLVMVICAVGAFTMMGGGGSGKATTSGKTTKKTDTKVADNTAPPVDKAQQAIDKILTSFNAYGSSESRDPFATPAGAVKPVDPPKNDNTVKQPTARPPRTSFPRPDFGSLPPVNPGIGANLPTQIVPRFKVKGVLVGARPIVVVEDSNGNQRLVPEGGQLDPTTRVTSIEKGQITVNENGKSKTLPIEEHS